VVAGAQGVTTANLAALNSALASTSIAAAQVNTLPELQTLVDAYNRILDEANGSANDLTVADPTAAQYLAIGANIGLAAQSTAQGANALALLNDSLGAQVITAVDSVTEIDALASTVTGIMTTAAGSTANPALTAAALTSLGLSGVTDGNLAAVLAAIAASADNGSQANSLTALQSLIDDAVSRFNALSAIEAFADSNAALSEAPSLSDFSAAGVSGVDNSNRLAVASALASTAITSAEVNTTAELQALVDAYRLILAEANGSATDATPGQNPTVATYSAIGATTAASLANGSAEQALLGDTIANLSAGSVDRVSKIEALATTAAAIGSLAAQSTVPTPAPNLSAADFAALGIAGVTADNLASVLAGIAGTANDGSGIDTQAELQSVVNVAIEAYNQLAALNALRDAAIARIAAYAGDATTAAGSSLPTLSDYQVAGVTGVSSANLSALNSALATAGVVGTAVDSTADIQALVDAYNRILSEANGTTADANASANPTAADYSAIGASTAASLADGSAAQSLLNTVIGAQSTSGVDSVAKIEALAMHAQAILDTAAGTTPAQALTVADFATLGISDVTPYNLAFVLAEIGASATDGSAVDTLAKLQSLVTQAAADAIAAALLSVKTYAGDSTDNFVGTAPALNDYLLLGITGVDAGNLASIQSALESTAVVASGLASASDVQTLVNAFNSILAEANGSATDATATSNPTTATYAAIGATTAAGLSASGLALLNDAIGNRNTSDVNTVAKIEALASTTGAIASLAALDSVPTPAPTLSADDFAALGITGVTADNLSSMLSAIAATANDGSGVDSITELQALVSLVLASDTDAVNAAINRIAAYAGDDTTYAGSTLPTLSDYQIAGVTGVSNANLSALNSALASVSVIGSSFMTDDDRTPVQATAAIQTLVDAYNRILTEANGATADANASANPTAADYSAIGASTAAGFADGSAAQSLLNTVIGAQTNSGVDSVAKIEALAVRAQAILATAAGNAPTPALTEADFSALGITGVTPYNLAFVLTQIAASADNGSAVDTMAELQAFVTQAAADAVTAALLTVKTYAGDANNAFAGNAPVLNDYLLLDVTGVDAGNLASIQSALASTSVQASSLTTASGVQTLVNAFNSILAEANGSATDATPGSHPTTATYTAIGATTAAGLSTSGLALLNDAIANLNASDVNTVAKIEALASTASQLQALAALTVAPTPLPSIDLAALAALGITGLNADNLPVFLALVAESTDNGTGADTLTELQTLVTQAQLDHAQILLAQQRQQAAIQLIQAYAGDSTTAAGSTAPTLADFATAGVTGITVGNLSAIQSALATPAITGAQLGTTVSIQALVNAYSLILAEANGSNADATPNANPTASTYAAIGATTAAAMADNGFAQSLLNNVIGQSSAAQVDSVAEIEALASAVNAVMNTAANANPQATAAHFATLGITGVHADNLAVVLATLQATADDGSGARTQAQLQALVDSVNARLLGIIAQYAQTNSGTAPTVADYARAGISGVDSINIFAVNSALASAAITGASVDTVAKAQTVVDSFRTILAEANGLTADATPAQDPTAQDYQNIGATSAGALDALGLALLNDVVGDLPFYAVDSVSEIEALAQSVGKIMALANNQTPASNLTLQDMQALGITGVTSGQLPFFTALLQSAGITATQADSLAELRTLLQTAAEQSALSVITQYAQNNTGTLPSSADFSYAGITGVKSQNLAAVQSALASASLGGAQADTRSEVQAIVNAYNRILAEANGALADLTPGQDPTAATYSAIGATAAASLSPEGLQLLNSSIGNLGTDKVDTVAKIEALAAAAQRVMAAAAGNSQALSLADLQALGLNTSGMDASELDTLKTRIADTVDNGSAVTKASDLQALIYAVMDRMPSVSGLQLSSDTGLLANDFITSQTLQTINASLSATLGVTDRLYGRLDGVVSAAGSTGWVDLTGMVQGTTLYWANAQLETGAGKTIQLQIARNGNLFSERLEQAYELITSAPPAPTAPPVLLGPNPSPSGMISLTVAPPPGAARVALVVDGRVIPSLYHAATNTIMALASLPEGNWDVQYRYEDRAGNVSSASPSAAIKIVSPQNLTDLQELDGDGIVFTNEKAFLDLNTDGIDDADQRNVATLQMTGGQNVAIDATVQSPTFSTMLDDPGFNQGGYLKVEIQIDGIQNRAVTTSELLSASLGGTQTVTNVTDVLEFRLYPQIIRTGLVDESQVDLLAAPVINQTVGQIQRIDLRLPEGRYNTYFKVNAATQTVWAFNWDAVSGTGAVFTDSNGNGLTDTVSLFIRDGGRGDDDGVADGVILDPGFVAMSTALPTIELDLNSSFTVDQVINAQEAAQFVIKGSAEIKVPNQSGSPTLPLPLTMNITLRDRAGNSISDQYITDISKEFLFSELDLDELVDGIIQATLSATDEFGGLTTSSYSFKLDRTPTTVAPKPANPTDSGSTPAKALEDERQSLFGKEGFKSEIDFSAFGFDARSLDRPDPLWTSLKGELPKPVPSLLSPSTDWLNKQSGKRSWNDGPSTTQNWMNAGEDWGPTPKSTEWFAADGPMTRGDGFQVVVTRVGDGRLAVLRGQADQLVPAGETSLILIAPDAFGHLSADAEVRLSLTLDDGKALPAWARFNGKTGQLLVQPPADAPEQLLLRLTAVDQDGETVSTVFRLDIGKNQTPSNGRMSFSEKLRASTSVTLAAPLQQLGAILRHG
jgi:hypothetical protein